MDDRYVDYKVTRKPNGSLDVGSFDRDPSPDYWYDPNIGEWVAKNGSDAESNLSVSPEDFLATNPMGVDKDGDTTEVLDRWMKAASEYDQATGNPGSLDERDKDLN